MEIKMLNRNTFGGYVVVTADCFAGSSSKGSLNAWLADKHGFDIATVNWFTNAGHYVELDDGTRILTQQIPSSFINPNTELYINAGAGIDIEILTAEIDRLEEHGFNIKDRLFIHPHANVITQEDKDTEKRILKSGSTFKGCGAAAANKVMRQQQLAYYYDELAPYIKNKTEEMNQALLLGAKIIVETAQGIDLDLNHAEYPYCTSRQTIPAQAVADAGIAPHCVTNTIINIRTHPIRINNKSAADGSFCYTGNYWDAEEISWEQVATEAGYAYDEFMDKYKKSIMTSVTKMPRRVFTWPRNRFDHNMHLVGYYYGDNVLLSLNFVNFIDKSTDGVKSEEELKTERLKSWLHDNMGGYLDRLRWIRTGPQHSQVVELPEGCSW
jgi:hypothetical protein